MGKVIRDWAKLEQALEGERKKGRKVVFTNGCFDLIHVGHVRYMREARKLGDVLVVGLNSDSSVSRIKPGRPVTPEDQRAEVLASLDMVDYVTVFDEPTPYALIKSLRPDVLVKGGDWKPEDIVGSDLVPVTKSLPYFEGISTSQIIEKIKRLKDG